MIPLGLKKFMEYEKNIDKIEGSNKLDFKFSPECGEWFEVKSYWLPVDETYIFKTESKIAEYFFNYSDNKCFRYLKIMFLYKV